MLLWGLLLGLYTFYATLHVVLSQVQASQLCCLASCSGAVQRSTMTVARSSRMLVFVQLLSWMCLSHIRWKHAHRRISQTLQWYELEGRRKIVESFVLRALELDLGQKI